MWETFVFQIIWGGLYGNCHYMADFSFKLMNYQGFQNNWVNLYEFFLLGM
jgi:hypothetical protein